MLSCMSVFLGRNVQEHTASSQARQGHTEESKECFGEMWVTASTDLLGGLRDLPVPGLCTPETAT